MSDCETCQAMANSEWGVEEPHEAHSMDTTEVYEYDDFCEQAGFVPLDEPDITYLDVLAEGGLEEQVNHACQTGRFISVRHNDEDNELDVTFGWGIVNVLHRCFIPDGIKL